MPVFKVHLNGKRICTAGLPGDGVLGAHVSWVRRKGARGTPELSLHVGGLDSSTGEHLVWQQALPMRVGDFVRIEVAEAARTDAPATRQKADPAADLRARKRYVRKMAAEFGWKLVIPK